QLGGRGSVINTEIADVHFALDPRLGNGFVQAIQTANERGFPAARGADQRGRVIGKHGDVDVEQGLRLAVKRIQVLDCNSDAHRSLSSCPGYAPANVPCFTAMRTAAT